jgi:hypothetical protein
MRNSPRVVRPILYVLLRARGRKAAVRAERAAARNGCAHSDMGARHHWARSTSCSRDLRLTSRSHAHIVRAVERVRPRSSATRRRQPASTAQPKIEGSAGVESRTLHTLEQRCATHLALSDPYCTCCRGRAVEKQRCAPSGQLRKTTAHTAQRNGRGHAARSACRTGGVTTRAHKTYILYSLCGFPSCGGEAVRRGGAQTKRNGVAKKRANRCHTTGSLG